MVGLQNAAIDRALSNQLISLLIHPPPSLLPRCGLPSHSVCAGCSGAAYCANGCLEKAVKFGVHLCRNNKTTPLANFLPVAIFGTEEPSFWEQAVAKKKAELGKLGKLKAMGLFIETILMWPAGRSSFFEVSALSGAGPLPPQQDKFLMSICTVRKWGWGGGVNHQS